VSDSSGEGFDEAILGFRVWRLGSHGELIPFIGRGPDWVPGENRARCLVKNHKAPHAYCGCGFNALHAPPRGYVRDPAYAVGAIAAWGEVDVFNTGFRAEFAKVIAIARPHQLGPDHREKLRLAAERYGVPLVRYPMLADCAAEYAAAVPKADRPGEGPKMQSRKHAPQPLPAQASLCSWMRGSGVHLAGHLAFAHIGNSVRLAPTSAVMAATDGRLEPTLLEGDPVAAGEPLFAANLEGEVVSCASPVSGVINRIRPPARVDLATGPGEDGWAAEIETRAEPIDDWPISWGMAAADRYRQHVLAKGSDAAVLEEIGGSGDCAVSIASAESWLESFGDRLNGTLAADTATADAVDQLGIGIAFDVRGAGTIGIHPGDESDRWMRLSDGAGSDVRLSLDPHAFIDYWSGSLVDGAGALADVPSDSDPIRVTAGSPGQARLAMSIHQRLFPQSREHLAELGDPWFRAGEAVRDGGRNRRILAGPITRW